MFSLLKEVKVNGSIGKEKLPIFSAKEPGGILNVRVTLFIMNMLVAQVNWAHNTKLSQSVALSLYFALSGGVDHSMLYKFQYFVLFGIGRLS